MAYTPSYDALIARKRRLTDAAVPGQGLLESGADADTIGEFAGRRAKELESSYRARDTERGLADLDAQGALHRRRQRIVGQGNVERFRFEQPMRESAMREEREALDAAHERRIGEIGLQNEGRLISPYLNYLGKSDATAATRERTKAQYGDPMAGSPDAAEGGSGGIFGAIGSLFSRLRGGGPEKPAPAPGPAAGPAVSAGPGADAGGPETIEDLVGQLKRAYPGASPRDLVGILNDEVEFDDPAELEAATRMLLGLGR